MHDSDLTPLLSDCTNEDLEPLVSYLSGPYTQALTRSDGYKKHHPNHRAYVDDIVHELQMFGGNTFMNILRGFRGVPYATIVRDVCYQLSVAYTDNDPIEDLELRILQAVLMGALAKMDPKDLAALQAAFQQAGLNNVSLSAGKPILVLLMQLGTRSAGFAAYQVAVIVANSIARIVLGRGLTIAGNAVLTRTLGVLLGPMGLAITAVWTLIDLAGPAFRVTIPCVCHVAYLRLKKKFGDLGGTALPAGMAGPGGVPTLPPSPAT